MFDESSIPDAVHLLERRDASLWHACQLVDLAAYLRLGGIGSAEALERRGPGRTSAPTDGEGTLRDRILCSLDDIGHGFAAGWALTPNIAGPITLQLAPAVLAGASDAAFCLRSAGSPGFDVGRDSLVDVDLIDELFWFAADAGFPHSTWLRFGDHLTEGFGARDASSVEVLLSPRTAGILDLGQVVAVWVDPVAIDRLQLIDVVSGLCDEMGVALRIRRRTMIEPSRADIWADATRLLHDGELPLMQLVNRADASPAFRAWALEMQSSGRSWIWERFARRVYAGTLRQLAVARSGVERPPGDGGFWSRSRRVQSGQVGASSATATATRTLPNAVVDVARACGHRLQPWENGTCYACLGDSRSAWRYDP